MNMASFYSALSPCIGVCQLDQDTGYCIGCQRTGDEIMAWPSASDAERHAILAKLDDRRYDGGRSDGVPSDRAGAAGGAWRAELRHEPPTQ